MIERKVKERASERDLKVKDLANTRCQITRTLFHALSTEEQKEWEAQSVEDHSKATEEWKNAINSRPSISLEDRQL
jgi:predicted acetyltransferase